MLRIAFVTDRSGPFYPGGVEDRIWNLARRLARRHQVRVYTTLRDKETTIDGVKFIRVLSPLAHHYGTVARSRFHELLYGFSMTGEWLKGWKPDVVLVESLPFIHLPLVGRVLHRKRVKQLLTVDEAWSSYGFLGTDFRTPVDWIISALLRRGVRAAEGVIAVSHTTAESLEKNYGAKGVVVVPSAVNLDDYRPYRTQYASRTHRFDVISVGRLERIKGYEDLVRGLSLMRTRYGWKGKAAIVGTGSMMARLRKLSASLGIEQQLELFGRVDTMKRRELVYDSKLFVLTSEREGFSVATLEALASGVPALVARPDKSEVFGVSELVQDGVDGMYYPFGNPEALAERAWALLRNPSLLSTMSERAFRVASKYDWEGVSGRLESMFYGLSEERTANR